MICLTESRNDERRYSEIAIERALHSLNSIANVCNESKNVKRSFC